ncbi:MAG TPA: ABC transporter ATP-binding protein [Moorella mulderi]|nr:ABC transporter ATP-binding protein [Moorella mulderi]
MIQVKDLTFAYTAAGEKVPVLKGISFTVQKGESCAILGPSGCGKTTLLYLLAGLLAPGEGTVLIGGEKVTRPSPRVALIFQDHALLPWKTAWENAVLPLRLKRQREREIRHRITPLFLRMGLAGLEKRYPHQLSGGQRQRVALTRALALGPEVLLMDEPFASLDALNREALQDFFWEIKREYNLTVVLVTHCIEEAVYMGEKLIILSPLPARIREIIPNPGAGERNYRFNQKFWDTCSQIRRILEEGRGFDEKQD